MRTNSVYKEVTDRIIKELKKGNIPWEQPWVGGQTFAFNRVTGKPYSLLNQFILGSGGEYASFKQWNSLGGKIRRGERSKSIVFWKMIEKEIDDVDESEDEDEDEVTKIVPILRLYNVFHISQVEGVEPLNVDEYPDIFTPNADADSIIDDYINRESVKFVEVDNGNKAYYDPANDLVSVPAKRQFKSTCDYYATVFHELIHSTGHPRRLNRDEADQMAAFGSETYSKEELVAEIGSATILNMLGMETERSFRNNTAYIQSWIHALENDYKLIPSASSRAEKAIDLIINKGEAD